MVELTPDQFPCVSGLFAGMRDHLAIGATLRGIVPARVFVDSAQTPEAAMIWDAGVVFFLAGQANDETFVKDLSLIMATELTPDLQARGLRRWIRATCASDWEPYLPAIWGVNQVRPIECRYLEYRALGPPVMGPIPPELMLEAVDSTLLNRDDLANGGNLRREISSTWGSVNAFINRGFGYCLVEGDRLVSWCLSEYNHNGRCEFGVETAQDRQQRGLAGQTTAACIAHALAQGIRPGWHSWRSNKPSVALASSCGFELAADYTAYVVPKE